jgi:uncharacterized protein Yka (UPF0111/DUF47 family)
VTIEGADAFAVWAAGDPDAAKLVLDAEDRGDVAKRELVNALRAAFVTPLEPEDLFALSRSVDWVLNYCGDLVRESEVMACPPDARIAEMATLLGEALRDIDRAIACVESDPDAATSAGDAAIEAERRLERVYYQGMADLLDVGDRTERIARRELYRRCARIGDTLVDTAERIAYAVVKQS